MPAFPSNRKLNIMSTPTLVGSNVVQAVGVAHTLKDEETSNSIVLVSVGDGATQQGDFYEAVSEASRAHLPVLFLIEDNRYACPHPPKYILLSSRWHRSNHFCGFRLIALTAPTPSKRISAQQIIQAIRDTQSPEFLFLK